MDSQRNFLIVALILLSFIIWETWEKDKILQIQQKNLLTTDNVNKQILSYSKHGKQITVVTDVLELTINTYGGDVEQALLLKYPKDLKYKKPFNLLETKHDFIYQAQSGLIGQDGPDNSLKGTRPLYSTDKTKYILDDKQDRLFVLMSYKDKFGNIFTKTFNLKKGEYDIEINHIIQNNSNKILKLSIFGQLKQSNKLQSHSDVGISKISLHTFRGAAYSTHNEKYEKYKFDKIANNEHLNVLSKGGWIAMLQQYFATAWIPHNNFINNFYTANLNKDTVAIGYKSQPFFVQTGQTIKLQSTLWIGPKIQDKMAIVAPYLDLTIDYGWLWFIAQPMFKLLKFIYSYLGNWGYSIIVITFILRGFTYPLTKAQYISMARMRMLQPKIKSIRERFSNDKQRVSQEIVMLYKTEQINPLGGCFPLLVQMPIFLALYCMLISSVELHHAPFIFWIHDLSAQDPYYILPIMMGITMCFIQKTLPSNITDPIHQKMVIFMPIIFTIFFLWFPSGLVIYYIVSNIVTIIQQRVIFNSFKKNKYSI